MGTFIFKRKYFSDKIKQKKYSGIWEIDGELKNGTIDNVKRDQSYYDSLAKDLKEGKAGGLSGVDPNANKIGSNAGVRTKGGQTVYNNQLKNGDIYDMGVKNGLKKGQAEGFKMGQNSVGIKQGAMNTWRNMGTFGKAATVAGGVALIGGAAKLLGDRNKNKN